MHSVVLVFWETVVEGDWMQILDNIKNEKEKEGGGTSSLLKHSRLEYTLSFRIFSLNDIIRPQKCWFNKLSKHLSICMCQTLAVGGRLKYFSRRSYFSLYVSFWITKDHLTEKWSLVSSVLHSVIFLIILSRKTMWQSNLYILKSTQ